MKSTAGFISVGFECLSLVIVAAFGVVFSFRLHPDVTWMGRVAFALLVAVVSIGPVFVSLTLMGFFGVALVVGLPLVMGLATLWDKSEWIWVSEQTLFQYSKIPRILFCVMTLGCASYVFYQLSAAWLMGDLGTSYWIFNVDNAVRTEIAWRVHEATSYPPGTFTVPSTKGAHYHFGSVALGSLLSDFFNGDVGTAYLRSTTPLLLLPAILTPALLIYLRTKKLALTAIPFLIFSAHFVEVVRLDDLWDFGSEIFNIGVGIVQGDTGIVRDVLVSREIHRSAQFFGNMVLDGANVSILVLSSLMMAGIVGLRQNSFGMLMFGLAPIAALMNTRLAVSVTILVVASLVMIVTRRKARHALLGFIVVGSGLALYHQFASVIEVQLLSANFSVVMNPEMRVRVGTGTYVVLTILLAFLGWFAFISFSERTEGKESILTFEQSLLAAAIFGVSTLAGTQPLINGHYNLYEHQVREYLEPTMVLWGLFTLLLFTSTHIGLRKSEERGVLHSRGRRAGSVLVGCVMVLGIGWGILDGYHSGIQAVKLWVWPETAHDAVNFVDYRKCLDEAGSNAVLATNSLRYPSANFHRERQYVVHLHLKGQPRSVYAASAGLTLLREPNTPINEIKFGFAEMDVTHLLIDKSQPWPLTLKEHFIYSNNTCAVIDIERLPAR